MTTNWDRYFLSMTRSFFLYTPIISLSNFIHFYQNLGEKYACIVIFYNVNFKQKITDHTNKSSTFLNAPTTQKEVLIWFREKQNYYKNFINCFKFGFISGSIFYVQISILL